MHAITAPLRYGHLRSWQGNVPMQATMHHCGTSAVAIHRAELMAALVQSLEQERLYSNMQGIGFEQDEDGVRLRFASGEEVQGDLLIGADGLHSIVRSQLFGATKPRYAGYTAWRAVTHFPKDQFEAQTAFETWEEAMFLHISG